MRRFTNSHFDGGWQSEGLAGSVPTNFYMGPGIHPRLKQPVGQRLGIGAMRVAYGDRGVYDQATIAGCRLAGAALSVSFDEAQLGNSTLSVQPYNRTGARRSAFSVLVPGENFTCVDLREDMARS